jgi:hypothetical protein
VNARANAELPWSTFATVDTERCSRLSSQPACLRLPTLGQEVLPLVIDLERAIQEGFHPLPDVRQPAKNYQKDVVWEVLQQVDGRHRGHRFSFTFPKTGRILRGR